MRGLWIAAAVMLGAATMPAAASETYPGAVALDQVEASFTRHTREHRMWEIQRNTERQQRYGRRGGGYDRGYGYRRGYGPPPHARAYGRRDRFYDRY
jgi:Ni/Co efflux regulator RcnB